MIRSLSCLLGLVLLLAPPAPAFPARPASSPIRPARGSGDETLQNFKKYYSTYKDTPSRVEAVLTLEGLEEPEVVALLLPKLKDQEADVARAIVRVFSSYKT